MKKLTVIFSLMMIISLNLKAQNKDREFLIKEYLQQSEKQKKTGITFFVVGSGMAALGLISLGVSNSLSDGTIGLGYSLILIGIPVTVIGLPIIISSASKARKAAQLSVGAQTVRAPILRESQKVYPAITFTVNLNSSY
ncbi:hypothetical protein [Cognataquiflexum rubidum]|uniref:hypothetical protein n=1 Tax=Cognataquiflexum rubidum TaxID=2922273 RepID=UPI001F13F9D6|nr:hypothetical protein [Cognataquiflexum rubidum]MCH6234710.1 hypothetical protein [Cognataquiflexum rubidum]